jgi:MFS family permease
MGLLGTMSAMGTALGPSLGGALIAAWGWRAVFFIKVPLGGLALVLVHRHLPGDHPDGGSAAGKSDPVGALLLTSTLVTYALAMTLGRGHFGHFNVALLVATGLGSGAFIAVEARARTPLIRLGMLREAGLRAGLLTSALVSMVIMVTLVVGPFYLSRGLGLDAAGVGLVMSAGPLIAALTGAPAGRVVDRSGPGRVAVAGLGGMAGASLLMATLPQSLGIPGYVAPLIVMTAGYALFQTANNTAVMSGAEANRRGVVSGLLNLSRNVGLISGASVMGAVFAWASGSPDVASAPAADVGHGMRTTFAVAAGLIVVALGIAVHGNNSTASSAQKGSDA